MSLNDNLPMTIDIHSIAVFLLKRKSSEWLAHCSFPRKEKHVMKKPISLQLAAFFSGGSDGICRRVWYSSFATSFPPRLLYA